MYSFTGATLGVNKCWRENFLVLESFTQGGEMGPKFQMVVKGPIIGTEFQKT